MTRLDSSHSTWTMDDVATNKWDVVVIGAGPAGALAARQAATAGLKVLLVESKQWPRDKVCGGCLNLRALAVLGQLGLASELRRSGAVPIDEMQLIFGGRTTRFELPPGLAISRTMLDALLVDSAASAGAKFLSGTTAVVEPKVIDGQRYVSLTREGHVARVAAPVVVVADGLGRSSLKNVPDFATQSASDSRIGVGATIDDVDSAYPAGRIVMVVARSGYVGLTRVENNRLNIAAALDTTLLHEFQNVHEAIASILLADGLPVPVGIDEAAWRGRPPLTSRPGRVAGERLFVIGDAGGYVEPFTGEGIAAAFESAFAVMPLVVQACLDWDPSLADSWEIVHYRIIQKQQATCRVLAWTLRRPWSVSAALGVCRAFPPAANFLIRRINRQPGPRGRAEIEAS